MRIIWYVCVCVCVCDWPCKAKVEECEGHKTRIEREPVLSWAELVNSE